MKKLMMIVAACAAMVACNQSGKTATNMDGNDSLADSAMNASAVYEGTIPAADGPGIRYNLELSGDTANTFHLTETYLAVDNGKDEAKEYDGKAELMTKTVNGEEKKAYKLDLGEGETAQYLLVVNDSTLRLVNDRLEESANKDLNYDLKLKK
ncbi:MAG TPA: copper resistance protein NlpE N-terminal domain-containing protein [Prevotella sp.]